MKHNYVPSLLLVLLFVLLTPAAMAQLKVGDNPSTINKASVLELESVRQGLLLPRIADTTLSPLNTAPDGMIIYFTGNQSLLVRRAGYWSRLADSLSISATGWKLTGNAGTTAANYIGTTDGQPLSIRTNATEAIHVNADQTVQLKNVPQNTALISTLVIDPATGAVSQRSLSASAFAGAIESINGLTNKGITIKADTANANFGVTPNAADSSVTVNIPIVNGTTQRTGLLTYADWLSFSSKQQAITIGALLAAPNPNGMAITNGTLQLAPADATNPGAVSTTAQTFGGQKTFQDSLTASAGLRVNGGSTITNGVNVTGGGANITGGVVLGTVPNNVSTATTTLLFRNPTTGAIEKRAIDSAAFSGGIKSVNSQTGPAISIVNGKAGTNVNIDSTTTANRIVINIPDASATARGIVTDSVQTFAGNKTVRDSLQVGLAANVGGTAAANSTLQVSGSMAMNITTLSSNGTLAATDNTVLVNTTSGSITVTLPSPTGIRGRIYTIKKIGSGGIDNSLTISPTGGTIDGASTYVIYNDYTYVTLQTDGTNWYVIRK
ncbi:hypothetical protein SAMN05444266_10682 [Chitinophaga jiangningensis]|uniref:Uncharacterized protein n=1 Tax=Chitinophaga jiangningensis TaxID=1419482 RepID=A0A1M7FC16_9BACT|nr:hypothetical protein [Chitinophaga jiangningensis]SHM01614.1 hypothetical protein SAMN05444266_10682 [Chitinophaga jiangningensis]